MYCDEQCQAYQKDEGANSKYSSQNEQSHKVEKDQRGADIGQEGEKVVNLVSDGWYQSHGLLQLLADWW